MGEQDAAVRVAALGKGPRRNQQGRDYAGGHQENAHDDGGGRQRGLAPHRNRFSPANVPVIRDDAYEADMTLGLGIVRLRIGHRYRLDHLNLHGDALLWYSFW